MKITIAFLITLMLFVVGSFYWFEIRPIPIRERCAEWAFFEFPDDNIICKTSRENTEACTKYTVAYQYCENSNGLTN